MTSLTDIFNQELFDGFESHTTFDYSTLQIDDLFQFFADNGTEFELDYSQILNALPHRHTFNAEDTNSVRRGNNKFKTSSTAQNSLFCSTLTNVLPTIKSSSIKYIWILK